MGDNKRRRLTKIYDDEELQVMLLTLLSADTRVLIKSAFGKLSRTQGVGQIAKVHMKMV